MDDLGMDIEHKEDFDITWQLERLDEIKKKFPELKLTCFTVPDWEMNGVGLKGNKLFKGWFNKNKDWVEIAIHGLNHREIEGNLPYDKQCQKLRKALEIMKEFLPSKIGYKAPANDTNKDTLRAVYDCGYDYLVIRGDIRPRGSFEDRPIFESHIQTKGSFFYWSNKECELLSNGFK